MLVQSYKIKLDIKVYPICTCIRKEMTEQISSVTVFSISRFFSLDLYMK